jgi:MFS family permease
MARLLNGSAIEAFWAGTSFILTSTVFQPPIGAFSHIFGRKPMIYISMAFFGAGAIVAALANNFTVVLVGRSIQGIGGGGVIILTEIVVTDLVPLRLRGQWFSMISSMWALGTVVGPLLGGGFSQSVTWRWIFWINLPFIGIGLPMIIFFLKLNFPTSSFLAKLRRVDWIGTVVFIGATTGFLVPLSWGGIMEPWNSWRTLVPLILCGIALVAFVVYEEYVPAEPMIRTSVFKNQTAAVTYLATFIREYLRY